MTCRRHELDVVVPFADISFGGVDCVQRGAGVEREAVRAIANNFSCLHINIDTSSKRTGIVYHISRGSGETLDGGLLSRRGKLSRDR